MRHGINWEGFLWSLLDKMPTTLLCTMALRVLASPNINFPFLLGSGPFVCITTANESTSCCTLDNYLWTQKLLPLHLLPLHTEIPKQWKNRTLKCIHIICTIPRKEFQRFDFGKKSGRWIVLWLHREAGETIGVPAVTSRYILKATPHDDTCLICSGGKVNKTSSGNECSSSRMT